MTYLRLIVLFGILLCATQVDAASRFGVCTITCTWDNSSTAMWSASSGGAPGASAPTSSDTVTLDAATCVGGTTCTITVNANLSINNFTMGACTASTTGCVVDFSANNNNITIVDTFNNSGTGTRTLNMGGGVWTINSTNNNPWLMGTVTGLTFNANSSTIVIAGSNSSSRAFNGGGKTYNNLTASITNNGGNFTFVGANTFATLTLNGPQGFLFPAVTTTTITTLVIGSSSSSNVVSLLSNSVSGSASTLAVTNNYSASWSTYRDITITTGSTTATNSLNLGNVTLTGGGSITAPTPGGGGGRIIGGWLLKRDLGAANDNVPMHLGMAA